MHRSDRAGSTLSCSRKVAIDRGARDAKRVQLLDELRQLANQRDVPYQSLIKVFLRERIDMEHGRNFALRENASGYKTRKRKS